jgi:hypothetical protein
MKTIKLLSAIFALAAFTACDSAEDRAATAAENSATDTAGIPPSTPAPAPAKACCDKHTDTSPATASGSDADSLERMKRFAAIDSIVNDDARRLQPVVDPRDAEIARLKALAESRTTASSATANDPMITAASGQPAASTGLPAQEVPVKMTLPFLQQPPQGQLQAGTVTITLRAPAGMTVAQIMALTKAEEIKLQKGGFGIDKTTRKMVKLPPNHPAVKSRLAQR